MEERAALRRGLHLLAFDLNATPTLAEDGDPERLTAIGTTLFFIADDGADGRELFKSEPPYSAANQVQDINLAGDSDAEQLTNVNGTLLMRADDGLSGPELWRSSPPYTSASLIDIDPTPGVGSNPITSARSARRFSSRPMTGHRWAPSR